MPGLRSAVAFLGLLLAGSPASAAKTDVVVLHNGDHLTGERRDTLASAFAAARKALGERGLKTYAQALHDTADALAIAVCIANSERAVERRVAAGASAGASVLDRAAVAPMARGETPYERAVREALSAEAKASGGSRPARSAG